MTCPYQHYYTHQAGSGIGIIYKGVPHQRGNGIGSFLGGLFRSVLPLLTSGARVVGKEALNAGIGLLSDIASARPLKQSLQSRLKDVNSNLKRKADEKIDSLMSGSGYKNRRPFKKLAIRSKASKRKGVKKVRKENTKDIFSI